MKRAMCRYLDFGKALAERISLLEKTGFATAFNPKPILREYAGGCGHNKKRFQNHYPRS